MMKAVLQRRTARGLASSFARTKKPETRGGGTIIRFKSTRPLAEFDEEELYDHLHHHQPPSFPQRKLARKFPAPAPIPKAKAAAASSSVVADEENDDPSAEQDDTKKAAGIPTTTAEDQDANEMVSPTALTYTGDAVIPITSVLEIVKPQDDTPRGVWPVFRLMVCAI